MDLNYSILQVAPIVLLPFFAFVINAFIVKKFTNTAVFISCAAIFGSFVYSFRIFYDFIFGVYSKDFHVHKVFTWFDLDSVVGTFPIQMGIYIDTMGAIMLLMVSGAAFLIHLFSTYYMADDARYGRFFVYLSLFTSAMLGLVLSENLLSVFIFWEIMGFCSYSLIGFYYEKEGAGDASIKAFMTTRVGDVFFLLGIVAIWTTIGSVSFVDIYSAISNAQLNQQVLLFGFGLPLATFAAFCIFMGTIGKSAQVPLQVWLPDAMWGPTPCSALIHAATMVAAGVYLSLRIYPLLELGGLLPFVAYIGGITAFGAATIALVQTDIKAVLAYSTISQLGYMVLGIGVGAYNASFMHLITHAIFKACLFLSAGSVIHSLHDHHTHAHVQEMPRMGGLKEKMPFTFLAMMFCTLAITGAPFFSGFVSKDRILGDALLMAIDGSWTWWGPAILGFAGAALTAFYMFRMMFLTFFGTPRDKDLFDHTKKEKLSYNRNVPLLILSVFTLGLWFSGSMTGQGLVKAPFVTDKEWFKTTVEKPSVDKLDKFNFYKKTSWDGEGVIARRDFKRSEYDPTYGLSEEKAHHIHVVHYAGAILSVFIFLFGLSIAYLMYIKKSLSPDTWIARFGGWYKALRHKYYFDDFYVGRLIKKGLLPLNNLLSRFDLGFYDRYMIDGWEKVNAQFVRASNWFDNLIVDRVLVDGTGTSVRFFNVILRTIQNGKIQFYVVMVVLVLASYIWSLNLSNV